MNVRNPWFVAGFLAGCAIGGALALLWAPTSGQDLVAALREHIQYATAEARAAGARAEADVLTRYRSIRSASGVGQAAQTNAVAAQR